MLNIQLDRLDGMVTAMRAEKKKILKGIAPLDNLGMKPSPMNSPDDDCATQVMLLMPTVEAANTFVSVFPSVIAGKTGRHTYTEWDQVLRGKGAAHPALNPYNHPDNAACRRAYDKDMCARSLDILSRTIMVPTSPHHSQAEVEAIIHNLGVAAKIVFGGLSRDEAELREVSAIDAQKFDMSVED